MIGTWVGDHLRALFYVTLNFTMEDKGYILFKNAVSFLPSIIYIYLTGDNFNEKLVMFSILCCGISSFSFPSPDPDKSFVVPFWAGL